ncbi:MAG: STAS domain-containing protein [Bryobacteraceae bacterium]
MALVISEHEVEGVEVLDCRGRLALGEEDLQFRNEIGKLVQAGKIRIAMNLGKVSEIDTTGLGTLLFVVIKLRKVGGRLALFNLNPKHLELLVMMKLEAVIEIFKDEQDAIDSFFPDRQVKRFDILKFVESMQHGAGRDRKEAAGAHS